MNVKLLVRKLLILKAILSTRVYGSTVRNRYGNLSVLYFSELVKSYEKIFVTIRHTNSPCTREGNENKISPPESGRPETRGSRIRVLFLLYFISEKSWRLRARLLDVRARVRSEITGPEWWHDATASLFYGKRVLKPSNPVS